MALAAEVTCFNTFWSFRAISKASPQDHLWTFEVIEGQRDPISDGRTWLRHSTKSDGTRTKGQCGKIDLKLLEGASISEIAAAAHCSESRVYDHLAHLQEFWNGQMEPHHLKQVQVGQVWSFDKEWLRAQILINSPETPESASKS
jgi:hypothetical protein